MKLRSCARSRLSRAALLLLALPGCWAYVHGPATSGAQAAQRRPAATLIVDESAFPWAQGQLRSALAQALTQSGAFARVEYSFIPAAKPDVEIRVAARAGIDDYTGWGLFANTATFLFILLPLPVMPYFEDWQLSADVQLELQGHGLIQIPVQLKVPVTHALFASRTSYQRRIRDILVARIRDEIVKALGSAPAQATRLRALPRPAPATRVPRASAGPG